MNPLKELIRLFTSRAKTDHGLEQQASQSDETEDAMRNEFELLRYLTASIEHDLRIPLESMQRELQLLGEAFPQAGRSINRVEKLCISINRILDTMRIVRMTSDESNITEKYFENVNICSLLDRTIHRIKSNLRDVDIYFDRDSAIGNPCVKGDWMLLDYAIFCILDASVDAIRQTGRGKGIVRIQISKESNNIRIDVRNNGERIDLDKFERVKISKSVRFLEERYWLGLFLANRIAGIHKGNLDCRLEADQSTCMSIRIPKFKTQEKSH